MPIPNTSNVDRALAWGYQAQISDGTTDLLLRLAVAPGRELSLTTAPLAAQQINTAQTPEEFRAEFGQTYARSDFTGGAGLDQAHQRNAAPNDFRRFFDSKGVDVFKNAGEKGDAYSLCLHKETEAVAAHASTEAIQCMVEYEDTIVLGRGNQVFITSNNFESVSTYTNGVSPNTVKDMALDGSTLYVAFSDGTDSVVQQKDLADSSTFSNYTNTVFGRVIEQIFAVKNIIISAEADGKLYELAGTGTPTLIKDLPSGEKWAAVEDAGAVILAASDGGYIYSIKEGNSGLELAGQTYIENEEIVDVLESNGIIFFSTAESTSGGGKVGRLYRGVLSNDTNLYNVSNRQLIKEFGADDSTLDHSPEKFYATRDQVYFGVIDSATETHLYSIYLPTLGYARDKYFVTSTAGKVLDIVVAKDQLFFLVAGVGLVQEASTYVQDGYLIMAAGDFFTSQPKQWVGSRLYVDTIGNNTSVQTDFSNDLNDLTTPSSTNYATIQNLEQGEGGDEITIQNVVARWFIPKITLRSNDGKTHTPEVYSFAVRAFPEPEDVILRLPVNVSDKLERPGKRGKTIPGAGAKLFNTLQRLEGKSVTCKVFRPDLIVRGILENVTLPVTEIVQRGSSTVFCTIQVRGQQVTNTLDEVTSLGVLGVGELGIYEFGS